MAMKAEEALAIAKSYTNKTLEGQGALKGEDGVSPIISINTNTSDTYKLDIADKNGTITTPNLVGKKGERGEIGQTGADGETPTITENADNTEEIYKLDFTTKNGTFTTKNIKGKQGLEGVSPTVTTNPDNTPEDYRLNITTKGGSFTTPNLRGPQGERGPIGESAVSAINPRGDYDVNAEPSYTKSDYITYTDGNTYVCKVDNPTNEPPVDGTVTDTYWQVIAFRGAQGLPGKDGEKGADGVTFTPSIDENGILSFTNNGGLENPNPIDIKGDNGVTFTPSIDAEGYLSFTNNGNLENPEPIKVLGQDGADGKDGIDGTTYIPSIGTVTTVESNAEASAGVTVDQETKEAVFHFEIPKGEKATQFTPSITENGELAWENDGDLPNPPTTPIQTLISTAPLGTVLSFAGSNAPNGYLLCDGASYKVADYEDLYAVIGNTYGGDTENFNVPNLIDKFIQGSNTSGTKKEAGLPNIEGTVGVLWGLGINGAFTGTNFDDVGNATSGRNRQKVTLDASKSNPIYGNSDTVQPPALTMVYIIKAKHTNEGQDEGVSDSVIEYVDGKIIDTTTSTDTVWSSKKTSDEIDALISDTSSTTSTYSSAKIDEKIAEHSLPIAFDSGIINNSTVQVYKLANVGYTASGGTDAYNLNLLLSSRGAEEIELIGGKNDGGWIIEAIRNNKSFNKITNIYQDGLDIYVRLDLRCNYFRVYHKSGVLSGNFAVSLVDTVPESATELTVTEYATKKDIDGTTIKTTSTTGSEYYAITFKDKQFERGNNQGILIQHNRLNFEPVTFIFSASSYNTASYERDNYDVTKINGAVYNPTSPYMMQFYMDKANNTLYLSVPSYSGVTLTDLQFKSDVIAYTKVNAIPDTATKITATEYASINDTSTGDTTSTWSSSKINSKLGGLSFSASGTTLSITDGTNTWTLVANS